MIARSVVMSLMLCLVAVHHTPAHRMRAEMRDSPRRTTLPAGRVVVPLEMHDVQPVVEVRVNGEGPFRFLVDTGAAGCGRISAALADKLALEEVGEVLVGDPSGRNAQVAKRVGVDAVSVGDALFEGLSMMRRDDKERIDVQREGIDGILGFGLFRDCLLTLDYPGRRLILDRGQLPGADGRNVLDHRQERGIPEITLRVAGLEVEADIDSGSMGPLSFPQAVADKLDFTREPTVVGKASTGFNDFEIKEAPLDGDVHIGTHVMEDPTVAIFGMFPRANLGGQWLRNFTITFDQRNGRVRFIRDEARPLEMKPRYRVGVMMLPGPEGLVVEGVIPGGAAEKAGLKEGDRITRINGEAAGDLGAARLRETFSSPKPIRLTVEREGEKVEVVLTPSRADQE